MTTMQAVLLLGPGKIDCQELPVPEPGPEDVVLKVGSALTCGTDLKAFLRGHPKMPPPIRFGHEYSGTIAAHGIAGHTHFREGRRGHARANRPRAGAVFIVGVTRKTCVRRSWRPWPLAAMPNTSACPVGLSAPICSPSQKALPFVEAALLEPVSVCGLWITAGWRSRLKIRAVIIGAGGFGLLHLIPLENAGDGAGLYGGSEPGRGPGSRANLAQDRVIARPAEEARAAVLEATGGRGADLVIECTAQPRRLGRIPVLCPSRRPGSFSLAAVRRGPRFRWTRPGCTMIKSVCRAPFHFNPAAVRQASELLISGQIPTEYLISGRYPPG